MCELAHFNGVLYCALEVGLNDIRLILFCKLMKTFVTLKILCSRTIILGHPCKVNRYVAGGSFGQYKMMQKT